MDVYLFQSDSVHEESVTNSLDTLSKDCLIQSNTRHEHHSSNTGYIPWNLYPLDLATGRKSLTLNDLERSLRDVQFSYSYTAFKYQQVNDLQLWISCDFSSNTQFTNDKITLFS